MISWNVKRRRVALLLAAIVALPAAAQVKNHREIQYPQLGEFKIERPEVYKLQNGMTVFLMEDHELPLIDVIVRIRTGANYEPADKTGVAGLFAQVLREGGTTSRTGDEIDDFLAARAAEIETGMGDDQGSASMNCLKQDFDDVFALFHDILRNPAFAADKLEVAKVRASAAIARRNDSIASIASREFRRLIYGYDSPLSRLPEYSTISAVDRAALVAWHRQYYHPNNMLLGVVGDFEPQAMKKKIEQRFGSWSAGAAFAAPDVTHHDPQPGVYFIEKDAVTQAYVRLGHLGIRISDPDYFAVQVMNEVLGGGLASRLFNRVRSAKGLAYSVGGGVGSAHTYPGIFQVTLSTKSSTMAEAVEALKHEVRDISENPPTPDELKRAKESILNSFVFNFDSKAKILAQQMTYAYYGMPADYLEQYRSNIEKVSAEDVARVAKTHVHPDKLRLLVVGKSADFDRPLDSLGKVERIDISIPPPPNVAPKASRPS